MNVQENREWVLHESTPDPADARPGTPLRTYARVIKAVLHDAAENLDQREVEALFDIVRRLVA
jgi:hypothetical protein